MGYTSSQDFPVQKTKYQVVKTEKGQACGTAQQSGVPRGRASSFLPRGPDDTAFGSQQAGQERSRFLRKSSERQLVRLDRLAKCNDALRVAGRS
jgi:hypothetical protein